MTQKELLWDELLCRLTQHFIALPDKPEETPETSLIALWQTVCGIPCSAITANKNNCSRLTSQQSKYLNNLIEQRLSGVPLALIPRKETELLTNATLDVINNRSTTELIHIDVCTGAGNIPVALTLKTCNLKSYAADISEKAIELCKKNIELYNLQNRVQTKTGDLLTPFESETYYKKIDILTCNPPYISAEKVTEMHNEISNHEPALAFNGGPFGIHILRKLLKEAPKYLKPDGWLIFEVGLGQGESIIKRMKTKHGYSNISPIHDSNGNIRTIMAQFYHN